MSPDFETSRRISSYGPNGLFSLVMMEHPSNPEQYREAIKIAREFRGNRPYDQFMADEFLVPEKVIWRYSGLNVMNLAFVVPVGPEALPFAPRGQWTTTSTRIFVNPERVKNDEPILAPSAYFESKTDESHFSLPALCEHILEQIKTSGKALAVWSGPEPFSLFWDNITQGLVYTPENAQHWLQAYYRYIDLVVESMRTNNLKENEANMRQALSQLGLAGDWLDTQSGTYLRETENGAGFIFDSLTDEAMEPIKYKLANFDLKTRLKKMGKLYGQLLKRYENDPVMLELI